VRGWLKAGVMEGDVFQRTERGTPQGGLSAAWDKPPYPKKLVIRSKLSKCLQL